MVIGWRLESCGCNLRFGDLPFSSDIDPGNEKKRKIGMPEIKSPGIRKLVSFQGVAFEKMARTNS